MSSSSQNAGNWERTDSARVERPQLAISTTSHDVSGITGTTTCPKNADGKPNKSIFLCQNLPGATTTTTLFATCGATRHLFPPLVVWQGWFKRDTEKADTHRNRPPNTCARTGSGSSSRRQSNDIEQPNDLPRGPNTYYVLLFLPGRVVLHGDKESKNIEQRNDRSSSEFFTIPTTAWKDPAWVLAVRA